MALADDERAGLLTTDEDVVESRIRADERSKCAELLRDWSRSKIRQIAECYSLIDDRTRNIILVETVVIDKAADMLETYNE